MPHLAKVNGQWKALKSSVKVAGQWQSAPQVYVKVAGVWKPLWSYSWDAGAWGDCSVGCGGGTQTRAVTCKRQDGLAMDDGVCARFAGVKPDTSQACNTQACITCRASLFTPFYVWMAQGTGVGLSWNWASGAYDIRSSNCGYFTNSFGATSLYSSACGKTFTRGSMLAANSSAISYSICG